MTIYVVMRDGKPITARVYAVEAEVFIKEQDDPSACTMHPVEMPLREKDEKK